MRVYVKSAAGRILNSQSMVVVIMAVACPFLILRFEEVYKNRKAKLALSLSLTVKAYDCIAAADGAVAIRIPQFTPCSNVF